MNSDRIRRHDLQSELARINCVFLCVVNGARKGIQPLFTSNYWEVNTLDETKSDTQLQYAESKSIRLTRNFQWNEELLLSSLSVGRSGCRIDAYHFVNHRYWRSLVVSLRLQCWPWRGVDHEWLPPSRTLQLMKPVMVQLVPLCHAALLLRRSLAVAA